MPSFAPANTAGLRAAGARRKAAYPAPLKALAGAPEYEILELTISPSSEPRTLNQAAPSWLRSPRRGAQRSAAPRAGGGRRAGPVQMRLQCRLDLIPNEFGRRRAGSGIGLADENPAPGGWRGPGVEPLRRAPQRRADHQRMACVPADPFCQHVAAPGAGVETGRIRHRIPGQPVARVQAAAGDMAHAARCLAENTIQSAEQATRGRRLGAVDQMVAAGLARLIGFLPDSIVVIAVLVLERIAPSIMGLATGKIGGSGKTTIFGGHEQMIFAAAFGSVILIAPEI